MSDMTKLNDEVRVIAEFGDVSDGTSYVEHGMAREIMRLRRILAALREPRKAVVEEAASKMHDASEPDDDCRIAWEECIPWYHITRRKMATAAIRAAVTAAEQEVGRE